MSDAALLLGCTLLHPCMHAHARAAACQLRPHTCRRDDEFLPARLPTFAVRLPGCLAAGFVTRKAGAKAQKAYEFAVDVAAGPPDSMFRWAAVRLGGLVALGIRALG